MQTLTYHPDTRTTTVNNCDEPDILEHLQHEVNGYVECVNCDSIGLPGIDMWVNEEGAINGLPYAFTANINHTPTPLFGNIVFARHNDDGDTTSLTDKDIKTITGMLSA